MTEDRATDQPFGAPPRALTWLSLAVLVATIGMAFVGAWRTGIGWDETYHVERMDNYLDHGWYVLDRDFEGDGPTTPGRTTYVYGPVTSILLHGWSVLVGTEGSGEVATTQDAYRARHVGVVLIGLVGLTAVAAISRRVLGRGWGLVTAAMLGALPLWTGMTMVNIKDVPVATGCTLVTLGLVLTAGARRTDRWAPRLGRVAALTAGTTLAVGTRPGIWTAVTACVTAYVVLALLAHRRRSADDPQRPSLVGFAETALSLVASAGLLVAAYPNAFTTPIRALRRSAEGSADFAIGFDSSRSYLFERVALTIPVVMTCLWIVGCVVAVRWLLRSVFADDVAPLRGTRVAVVGVQAFTLPVIAIALDSVLYNGLRQMLFVTPACAVLATIGLAWSITRLRERGAERDRSPRLRTGVLAVVAVGTLVVPVVDQALLFPFNYAYANVLADTLGKDVGSDYWRTSVRELEPDVPGDGQVTCSPFTLGDGTATRESSDGTVDCRVTLIGPLATAWRHERRSVAYDIPDADFYAVTSATSVVPPNCTSLHAVTRWRHGRDVVMSRVSRCRLLPPMLRDTEVRMDATRETWLYAVRGWQAGILRGGLASDGDRASIAFRLPDRCRAGCELVLGAEITGDTSVRTAQGRVLRMERLSERRARITLPADVIASAEDGLWLNFSRSTPGPLSMTFRSLRLLTS